LPEIQLTVNGTIGITAIASVSSLGEGPDETWQSYLNNRHHLSKGTGGGVTEWVAMLPGKSKNHIRQFLAANPKYKALDDSVLYGMYAARRAVSMAGWKPSDGFGINIGSSRGATTLFEKYHKEFLQTNQTATLSSPTTTLGNISSWIAHDLGTKGPDISHSITCSTALHALLNGVAWIRSELTDKFLVGGTEAPLTPFTIAQMKALKIYSNSSRDYPCRAMDIHKKSNDMVLGEGASVACLERGISEKTLAIIEGIGYATEPLEHNVSLSTDAQCFQRSMEMALGRINKDELDVIVMHAPGTLKGDSSEFNAIGKLFGENRPALTGNKWKTGHMFGASGMMSVELAILMLRHQQFIGVPFISNEEVPNTINRVLVNAVGFGGNAVSVLLKTPPR